LAEIALELQRALERRKVLGERGGTASQLLAQGDGWTVADVVCTSGPQDRPFEEHHTHYSVALVLAGSFQYRSRTGRALMTPGSVLLGNPGQCFQCAHEHADGDRCVSFSYAPDYLARLRSDAGLKGSPDFTVPRIPPVRALAPILAGAGANLLAADTADWEELAIALATRAVGLASGLSADDHAPPNAEARVTRTVRAIEQGPTADLTLGALARHAGLSPFHFLRTFERVTGLTPHQYIVRARLRQAAIRLSVDRGKILDVAFDCGFGDVSNFNRAFRAEFGVSPRVYQGE
jgi:AraC-like DNA-binding protein